MVLGESHHKADRLVVAKQGQAGMTGTEYIKIII